MNERKHEVASHTQSGEEDKMFWEGERDGNWKKVPNSRCHTHNWFQSHFAREGRAVGKKTGRSIVIQSNEKGVTTFN